MSFSKTLLSAALGASALTLTAASASAGIACVGLVCWHTTEAYTYPPESRVVVHEDTWTPPPDAKITWRERKGRGYWRDDTWVEW
jgi:hypothetical protein